jgi:hypothetical protein
MLLAGLSVGHARLAASASLTHATVDDHAQRDDVSVGMTLAAISTAYASASPAWVTRTVDDLVGKVGRRDPYLSAFLLHYALGLTARKDAHLYAQKLRLQLTTQTTVSPTAHADVLACVAQREAVLALDRGLEAGYRDFYTHIATLPSTLTVVSLSLSMDRRFLIVSRLQPGLSPLLMRLPLTHRRRSENTRSTAGAAAAPLPMKSDLSESMSALTLADRPKTSSGGTATARGRKTTLMVESVRAAALPSSAAEDDLDVFAPSAASVSAAAPKASKTSSKTGTKAKIAAHVISAAKMDATSVTSDGQSAILTPHQTSNVKDAEVNHFQSIATEFAAIMAASHASTHHGSVLQQSSSAAERARWWGERQGFDDRLHAWCAKLEDAFLGPWKGLVLGRPMAASLQAALASARRAIRDELAQSCGAEGTTTGQLSHTADVDALLDALLQTAPSLSDSQLTAAWAFLLPDASSPLMENGPPGPAAMGVTVRATPLILAAVAATRLHAAACQPVAAACPTGPTGEGPDGRGHVVLVMDRILQAWPWESCPVLLDSQQSVTRLPSLHIGLAQLLTSANVPRAPSVSVVHAHSVFYVVNPSGDLTHTEHKLVPLFRDVHHWSGIAGRAPSREEYVAALVNHDVVVYCGHSGGERYLKPDDLKYLPFVQRARGVRACAILFGCSSGVLTPAGDYDAHGVALAYLQAGCPSVVANLWDVTDGEIDRLSESFIQHWLGATHRRDGAGMSLPAVLPLARQACNLKYLTGAAPVCYGMMPVCVRQ